MISSRALRARRRGGTCLVEGCVETDEEHAHPLQRTMRRRRTRMRRRRRG